jgi:hypothetical protein
VAFSALAGIAAAAFLLILLALPETRPASIPTNDRPE